MHRVLRTALFCLGIGAAAVAGGQTTSIDHLVLSEIGIDPVFEDVDVSQYVEIFNPTSGTISLDNYFLADTNLYTSVTLTSLVDTGTSDNIIKFPAGHSLAPGQLAVVTHSAERFVDQNFQGNLSHFTNLQKSPLLFELESSRSNVPDMVSFNTAQTTESERLNFDLAKAREFVVLFHWNGATDLVQDVDMVAWAFSSPYGDGDTFLPKGPHIKGANGSQYVADTGNHTSLSVPGHTLIKTRTSVSREEFEVTSGGNGLTGHDESTESVEHTWVDYETHRKSPGLTDLVAAGLNKPPLFSIVTQSPPDPSSTSSVVLNVTFSIIGGDVTSVTAHVDTGSGYTPKVMVATGSSFSATLDPMPDDTIVKYYIEAADNNGGVTRLPKYAPMDFNLFVVDDSPVVAGDIVISEIMHSHIGDDKYEFVEFYNTRSTPINMAYFRFWNNELEDFRFPDPCVVPGEGYIVITRNPDALEQVFSVPEAVQVLDWGRFPLFPLDSLNLATPNRSGSPYIRLNYSTQSPWPTADWNAGHMSFNLMSQSGIKVQDATPGLPNPAPSDVSDWALY